MLDVARQENHGNSECEAQPKLVAKHSNGVACVVARTCGRGQPVAHRLVGYLYVIAMRHWAYLIFVRIPRGNYTASLIVRCLPTDLEMGILRDGGLNVGCLIILHVEHALGSMRHKNGFNRDRRDHDACSSRPASFVASVSLAHQFPSE